MRFSRGTCDYLCLPLVLFIYVRLVSQLMADKMRLYAGDEDVDLEELERALTIVKRKMADPEASFPGFLSNAEVVGVSASSCMLQSC